ncbi:hypothetical protein [Arthrobacter caoxuetaonis]|uniref:Uncharacterized protein n=1 Tax=Arthrobacter caoxuetaonis TaxID=2886935 RepID=A0A9X1MH40_9MICC|nr:hypothetical protein [Arthrobacter caoxuetaonis]MCC3299252.1 hypothetical protein [Arthrobacter caoxuetaonis]USQ59254.1 hypothetical protein NF551_16860 [Arthrobacter caoxuetaonis]
MAPEKKTPKAPRAKAPKPPKPAKPVKVKAPPAAKAPKPPAAPKVPKPDKAAAAAAWPDSTRPSLMFLPDKIRGARSRRRATRKATLMAAGILGLTAVAYVSVASGTAAAQSDLDAANAVTAEHTAFLEEHSAFQNYYDGFIKQKSAVAGILEHDMTYSKVIKALNDANTVNAVFTTITKAESADACPSSDLFAPSVSVGCLEVGGHLPTIADVGTLAASLGSSKEFLTDPYVTESAAGDEGDAQFKLHIGYTDKAFSFKGEKFRPTDEELDSISQVPAPAAAETIEEPAQ